MNRIAVPALPQPRPPKSERIKQEFRLLRLIESMTAIQTLLGAAADEIARLKQQDGCPPELIELVEAISNSTGAGWLALRQANGRLIEQLLNESRQWGDA